MKSKFNLLSLLVCLSFGSFGQQLAGTSWDAYAPGQQKAFELSFSADSVIIGGALAISSYTQNGNHFYITDKPGSTQCGSHTGHYTFTIAKDTLLFTNVSDTCVDRIASLAGLTYVYNGIGTEERILNTNLNAYPNPTNDILKLDVSILAVNKSYTLTNAFGQVVMQKPITATEASIDLSGLPKGVYYLFVPELSQEAIKILKN